MIVNRTSVTLGGPVLSKLSNVKGHPGKIYAQLGVVALIFDDVDQLAAVRDKIDEFLISERLEYLRTELRAERISYGELAELQGLADRIDPCDVELLEAAGVPEK